MDNKGATSIERSLTIRTICALLKGDLPALCITKQMLDPNTKKRNIETKNEEYKKSTLLNG